MSTKKSNTECARHVPARPAPLWGSDPGCDCGPYRPIEPEVKPLTAYSAYCPYCARGLDSAGSACDSDECPGPSPTPQHKPVRHRQEYFRVTCLDSEGQEWKSILAAVDALERLDTVSLSRNRTGTINLIFTQN